MADTGRPPTDWDTVIPKLEEVFALGGSDLEACFYAGISKSTLYRYQEEHPEFCDRKEALKEQPILKARRSVLKGIDEDPELALKFLERRKKAEFSLRTELTGEDGAPLIVAGEVAGKHGIGEATPSAE